jgi:hypothetical protein
MSGLDVDLEYNGERATAEPTWQIRNADGVVINWRVLLVARRLSRVPVVLVDPDDVRTLLASWRQERMTVPQKLVTALKDVFRPRDGRHPSIDEILVEKREKAIEAHRRVAEDVPHLSSEQYFSRMDALVQDAPLWLYHDAPPHQDPLPIYQYDPDILKWKGEGWTARSCAYTGVSVLYEKIDAKSYQGAEQERSLVLYGEPYERTNLCNLKPEELQGTAPEGDPLFVVRAADPT